MLYSIMFYTSAIKIIKNGNMSDKFDLDPFDLRLLELLQRDSRVAVPLLAEAVGLSAPACYRRVRRLRETGAIERDVAVVRGKTLGWTLSMVVLVVLEREGAHTIANLLETLSASPQVVEVAHVTGDYDFVVRVVASDMEDYGRLANQLFAADDRVRTFKTLVVINESAKVRALPAAT